MWAVFSLHVGVIFSVGEGGGSPFLHGGGGHYWACPHNNLCGNLLLSHFYGTDISNLPRSWKFEFF